MNYNFSKKYGDAFVERIIKGISLVGLLDSYYKANDNNPKTRITNSINRQFRANQCPYHLSDHKYYDFYINDEKKFFYCYGCGTTGNCIDFINIIMGEYNTKNYDSAIKILSLLLGYKTEKLNKKEKEVFNMLAKNYYNYKVRYQESDKNTLHLYYQIESGIKEYIQNGMFFKYGFNSTIKMLACRYCCETSLIIRCYNGVIDKIDFDLIKVIGAKEFIEAKYRANDFLDSSYECFIKNGKLNYLSLIENNTYQDEDPYGDELGNSYTKEMEDDLPF